jgi:cholesterol transport system auxiliary component
VLRVERFGVVSLYNTTRIVYRDTSFRRKTYVYHKWRANPGDLVTFSLSRDMKESGLFKAVLPYDSRLPNSHRLEGTVEEFLERDTKAAWEAVLSVSVALMKEDEPDIHKKILFQKTYRAIEPCRKRNPQSLAKAMSLAMAKVSRQIIRDIYDLLQGSG